MEFVTTGNLMNENGSDESSTVNICPPNNISNATADDEKISMLAIATMEWIAYVVLGWTVVGIGMLGNVLNLIVLTRPSLKGVVYSYLFALASSDIGVLSTAITMILRFTHAKNGGRIWISSFYYAHLEIPLSNFFIAASIFLVVVLTVDRFVSVCLPTYFKRFHTKEVAKRCILASYVFAFLLSAPLTLLKSVCKGPNNYEYRENTAVTTTLIWRIFIPVEESLIRFVPAGILAILNCLIIIQFRRISKRKREILSGGANTILLRGERISNKIYKDEKRMVQLLLSIVVLFIVTMTPVAILTIIYSEDWEKHFGFQVFRATANTLELCNFSFNFYIYFLCSKEFRRNFLATFSSLCPTRQENPPSLPQPLENQQRDLN